MKIYKRNVIDTKFDDELFDGYWSIGVIEHFIDGYDQMINEAGRILNYNGFAFISFPYISPLRYFKVLIKKYPNKGFMDDFCIKHFNQYALPKKKVIDLFEKTGFIHIASYKYNGILGWIEEITILNYLMRQIYLSKSKLIKPLRFIANYFL